MSILKGLIEASKNNANTIRCLRRPHIAPQGDSSSLGDPAQQVNEAALIASITPRQRKRFQGKLIIPRQILELFWAWGIRLPDPESQRLRDKYCGLIAVPKDTYPICGMKLNRFLEKLWAFYMTETDNSLKSLALYLYQDIVCSDLMPAWRHKIRRGKYRDYRIGLS